MWSIQEDRHCVAEVAALAEVSIPLVLCLQQVGQRQLKHLIHLWAGDKERVDRGLPLNPRVGHPNSPVPPIHLLRVGPEALQIQRAHVGKHRDYSGLSLE